MFVNEEEQAKNWKERIEDLIEKNDLSQQKLADKINEQSNRGLFPNDEITAYTQKSVSNWINVYRDGAYRWPRYSTMIKIAQYFKVDLGYLIGETNCETFDEEKVCKFLGMSEEAVRTIRLSNVPHLYRDKSFLHSSIYRADGGIALDKFLSNPRLLEIDGFLCRFGELERIYNNNINFEKKFKDSEGKYGKSWQVAEQIYKKGPENLSFTPTEKDIEAYNEYERLISEACEFFESKKTWIKVARYELECEFRNVLNELYPIE